MRLVGHGHAAIRATHTKTLEFTPDTDITERATCIVAVGIGQAPGALAGPVLITISVGDQAFTFEARANSSWDPGGTGVIRRSALRLPGTFATHASAAASDLPRSLVEALRDLEMAVEVTVEPIRGRPCAVLFALDPSRPNDPRLGPELAAADRVVAEDEGAARLVGRRVAHGSVDVDGRVLVLATRELPGQTVVSALGSVDVETVGLPPPLAAAAGSPSRAPLLVAHDGADPREILRDAPAGVRLVLEAPAEEVVALVRLAGELRGATGAILVQDNAPPVRYVPGVPIELPSRSSVHICFDAVLESTALDPRIRTAIGEMLADGVPTRSAARALATLTGWDRRRAYDAVLNWPSPE